MATDYRHQVLPGLFPDTQSLAEKAIAYTIALCSAGPREIDCRGPIVQMETNIKTRRATLTNSVRLRTRPMSSSLVRSIRFLPLCGVLPSSVATRHSSTDCTITGSTGSSGHASWIRARIDGKYAAVPGAGVDIILGPVRLCTVANFCQFGAAGIHGMRNR